MINHDLIISNARELGYDNFLSISCEECAELISAVNSRNIDSIAEECADVYICLYSLKVLDELEEIDYNGGLFLSKVIDDCAEFIKFAIKKKRLLDRDTTLRMSESDVVKEFNYFLVKLLGMVEYVVKVYGLRSRFEEYIKLKSRRMESILGD